LVEEEGEGRGFYRVWPWAPLPPLIQPDTTRGKGFEDLLDTRERSQQVRFLLLVGFAKEKRRER
jgi:hypothetical protein